MKSLNCKYILAAFFILRLAWAPLPALGAQMHQEEALVTNSFFETDIREALRDISAQTGVKIVADETVQGSVTIELKEVPLEEALRMVLSIGNYAFHRMPEGYYLVGLCTPNSPSFSQLSITEYYRPNYVKVRELAMLVSEFYQPYIKINEENNVMTITAAPEVVHRIKEDLLKLDQAQNQVMIEALVVELSEEGKSSLGVTWGSMLDGGFSIYPPSTFDYTKTAGVAQPDLGFSGTLSYELLARIHTLVSQGKAKIRANPHIVTIEGKQAEIYVGQEEFYLINVGGTAQAYYTLQSVATGVVLKITPYVDKNNQITVSITPEVSEVIGKGATNLPVITKRTAATTLRVNDSQTIAIGGLVQEQSTETVSRVPFLGAIPVLGVPFRHKSKSVENKEVVIFITPRLLGRGVEGFSVKESIPQGLSEQEYVKRYFLEISKIVEQNKQYLIRDDLKLRGPKEAVIEFTVFSSGTIGEVRVLRSSGIRLLDLNAVKLIENLSPLPAFPREIRQLSITFVIPIRYES